MNYRRMLLAGLVAGVIINAGEFVLNGVVLAGSMVQDMTRHNLVMAPWAMAFYVLMGFALGFGLAWLYVSIRPRYGAGFGTALIAAAALWTIGYILPTLGMLALGFGEATTYLWGLAWEAAELVIASTVAGALYREGAATATQAVPAP